MKEYDLKQRTASEDLGYCAGTASTSPRTEDGHGPYTHTHTHTRNTKHTTCLSVSVGCIKFDTEARAHTKVLPLQCQMSRSDYGFTSLNTPYTKT